MYVKVYASEKGNRNTGSCSGLVDYLEKENKEIDRLRESGIDPERKKEYFFNQERRDIQPEEVVSKIDNNKKGLHKEDAKFYELDCCPSKREMAHIGNDPEKLKDYVNQKVMPQYAEGFKRDVKPENLVWYGKVEYNRYYKKTDEDVKQGKAAIGEKKPGNNMHVQIIVSRKDSTQKMSLSPLANDRSGGAGKLNGKDVKKGFSRDDFKRNCEKEFDQKFDYSRPKEETFDYMNTQAKQRTHNQSNYKEQKKLSFEVDRESIKKNRNKSQQKTLSHDR